MCLTLSLEAILSPMGVLLVLNILEHTSWRSSPKNSLAISFQLQVWVWDKTTCWEPQYKGGWNWRRSQRYHSNTDLLFYKVPYSIGCKFCGTKSMPPPQVFSTYFNLANGHNIFLQRWDKCRLYQQEWYLEPSRLRLILINKSGQHIFGNKICTKLLIKHYQGDF